MDNIERHFKSIDMNLRRIIRLLYVILLFVTFLCTVYILGLVNRILPKKAMSTSYNQELHQGMDETINSAAK